MEYNIRGLKVRTNMNIDLPSVYEQQVNSPDLTIIFGSLPRGKRIGDAFYVSFPFGFGLENHFMISNLTGRAVIAAHSPLHRIFRAPTPSALNFSRATVFFKLCQIGYTITHGACLEKNGEGLILAGPSDSGKSCTALQLSKNHGFGYLSDDLTLVDEKGKAYCFATPIGAPPSLVKFNLKRKLRTMFNRLLVGVNTLRILPEEIISNESIVEDVKVHFIFFLHKGPIYIKRIEEEDALAKFILQSELGLGDYIPDHNPQLQLYAYDRGLDMERYRAIRLKVWSNLVRDAESYIVSGSPLTFSETIKRKLVRKS